MRLVYEQHTWPGSLDEAPPGTADDVQVVAFARDYYDEHHLPAGVIKCLRGDKVDYEVYDRANEWELQRAAITLYDEAVARAERKETVA